jgi:hypothetical protein
MLDQDDLWLMEELPSDEASELLETMPEMRRYIDPARRQEERGLRSLLERPEALSRAWWRQSNDGTRRSRKLRGRASHARHAA